MFIIGSAFSGNDGALDPIDDSYDWIEFDTGDPQRDEELRFMRLEAAKMTAATCRLGRYLFNEADIPLVNLPQTLEGTHVVLNVDGTTQPEQTFETEFIYHEFDESSLTEILLGLAADRSVTLLSAGSPYKVGGNFTEGSAFELEEMLCTQSTLQMSLRRASKMASEHGVTAPMNARPINGKTSWEVHIPEYGAVLSPNVEVFRAGPEDGFPFLEGPLVLSAVISVAMPNCNQDLPDEPCDAPESTEEYQRQLYAKVAAALELAVAIRSRTLVVPAMGCGRYLNDPSAVGKAFAEVFQARFFTAFAEVHFFGDDDFLVACSSLQRGATATFSEPEPLESLGARTRERRNAVDLPEQRSWNQDELMFAQEPGDSDTILDLSEPPTQLDEPEVPLGRSRRPAALDSLSDHGSHGNFSSHGAGTDGGKRSNEELREARFRSLKSAVGDASEKHIKSLETLQTSLSSLVAEQTVREQLDSLRHQALAIQDQRAVVEAQLQELEERESDLAAAKAGLLTQLEQARKVEAAAGCRTS